MGSFVSRMQHRIHSLGLQNKMIFNQPFNDYIQIFTIDSTQSSILRHLIKLCFCNAFALRAAKHINQHSNAVKTFLANVRKTLQCDIDNLIKIIILICNGFYCCLLNVCRFSRIFLWA